MTIKGKYGLLAGVAALAATASVPAYAQGQNDALTMDQLNARLEALEAEVQQSEINAAKTANTPAVMPSGWWDDTKVSGRMYFDVSNIERKTDGKKDTSANNGNGYGFDIKRFYIGVDHTFDKVFSANVTTDVTYDSATKAGQVYLKKAYLQAAIDPALIVRIGATDMPWIPYAEGIYGYRYLENTIVEMPKMGTSSDWGVHVLGSLADGILNYDFAAINGAGYKVIPTGSGTNRFKSFDYEGRINLVYDGFNVGIGGYTGHLGQPYGVKIYHSANRFDAIGSYNDGNGFRVGVEYFRTNNWNNVTTVATNGAHGISGFSSYYFLPHWAVFGRYDEIKPSTKLAPAMTDDYYNFGLTWSPVKIVDLSLTFKHDGVSHGVLGTQNGNIGGAHQGSYNEVGIFGDFQW